MINEAGGEILLDERVRRGGSHHQKLVVVRPRRARRRDVAFVGGIDLCHGRHDDARHLGDPQAVELDDRATATDRRGTTSSSSCAGPAVGDLAYTFRERWDDPTPLDHRNPLAHGAAPGHPASRAARTRCRPCATDAGPTGRTRCRCCARIRRSDRRIPFAPDGERSIARAYLKAFGRARRLVYLEDQYLWSRDAADALAEALRRHRELRVVDRRPALSRSATGASTGAASRIGRQRVHRHRCDDAGGDRVAVYDLENDEGTPIYVHAKVCIVDDVLARRRFRQPQPAFVDARLRDLVRGDRRRRDGGAAPTDPAGSATARASRPQTRASGSARAPRPRADDDDDLVDPASGFDALRKRRPGLDSWHRRTAWARAHPDVCAGTRPSEYTATVGWPVVPCTGSCSTPTDVPGTCAAPTPSDATPPFTNRRQSGGPFPPN